MADPPDDGYTGDAYLVPADGDPVAAVVTLSGHFDPISGKYSWYGRVQSSAELRTFLESLTGKRTVTLRTPHGEATTTLRDIDPWGRPRVEGFGRPPFPVLSTIADS